MEEVYFIGGAKGSGKSTICKIFSTITGLKIVNTGDFFSSQESPIHTKKRIIEFLVDNSPIIVDTHYAGFIGGVYSGKFERGLYIEELNHLNNDTNLELILLDLDFNTLIKRRLKDKENHRDTNKTNMCKELKYSKSFFLEYCNQLKKEGEIIKNGDLDESIKRILKIYWRKQNGKK